VRFVVCNGVGDRAAEHVKRILFGVVNLQDAKCRVLQAYVPRLQTMGDVCSLPPAWM
jgi:hypothetical protein